MSSLFSRKRFLSAAAALPVLILLAAWPSDDGPDRDWRHYLGDKASSQYSTLDQINTRNVDQLEVAWVYHAGDADPENRSQIQANPLIIDGVLYGTSPRLKVFALNAATGEEIWTFDPFASGVEDEVFLTHGVNRGLVFWEEGSDRRIFYSAGHFLHAIDAATGTLVPSFGENGRVDMRKNLGWEDIGGRFVISNTPGVIYKDRLIIGMRLSEGPDAAPGPVRAYDVRTGDLVWSFNTIPRPGEYGYTTWPKDAWKTVGGANVWTGMAVDEERGMVFVPTGSAAFDFYGGNRLGQNLFANTLLALNAETGERLWHFQFVHHDIWDRDIPAPPNLMTITRNGKKIDVVAQITKSGHVFVFDRDTGQPIFPIEEQPVPPSDIPGEEAWPTQPLPLKPPPFSRQYFGEEDITDISPESHAYIKERFAKLRSGGQFVPPSFEGTIIFPGLDGGGEWGGAAVDPNSGIMYVNGNEMAWILQLVPVERQEGELASAGEELYLRNCAQCHGADRSGDEFGNYPALHGVADRYEPEQVMELLHTGRGVMPSFQQLSEAERQAIVNFLFDIHDESAEAPVLAEESEHPIPRLPYAFGGYSRFVDQDGHPAVKPPWGTLNAIDLNEGEILWSRTLGELPELTARGIPPTGTENYGGPVVTAGGLIFIGATKDEMFRAFDKETGALLWETKLPAGGYATPATYMVDGKQYVVIAAGGGKMGTKSGDAYVAFALPD